MKEDTLRDLRVEAAKSGKSVSRYIADMIEASIRDTSAPTPSTREAQILALERILSGPKWSLMRDGRMLWNELAQ